MSVVMQLLGQRCGQGSSKNGAALRTVRVGERRQALKKTRPQKKEEEEREKGGLRIRQKRQFSKKKVKGCKGPRQDGMASISQ